MVVVEVVLALVKRSKIPYCHELSAISWSSPLAKLVDKGLGGGVGGRAGDVAVFWFSDTFWLLPMVTLV